MDDNNQYRIDGNDLFYHDREDARIKVCDVTDAFAIGWDVDGAVLLKHGRADNVSSYIDMVRDALARSGQPELAAGLRVTEFPITEETIREVNLCTQISNRVSGLEQRLTTMVPAPGTLKH